MGCAPPLNVTHPIKYLNRGLFGVFQTLGGHGHSGGYEMLLFGCVRNLTADIKGWITDYARSVLKDQRK